MVRQPLVLAGMAFLIPKSGEMKEQIHKGTEVITQTEGLTYQLPQKMTVV